MPADDGPADWQRIDVHRRRDAQRRQVAPDSPATRSTSSCPTQPIEPVALPAGHRRATSTSASRTCSFDVDQIGVPVLVKVSYFPNWQVDGAEGP